MNISIIGSGYVGLVTGACFAELGNKVICVDNDVKKISCLKKGVVPIYEPGLEELVKLNLKNKRLKFTSSIKAAVMASEVIFIAVGTPTLENGEADLTGIENVARSIAQNMDGYRLIVEKSTAPVETCAWVKKTISIYIKKGRKFDVVSNPEFLREGSAINDFTHPDRIILGVESQKAKQIITSLYQPLNAPILVTNIKSAELIKHASNAFLATKISFINAIARICDKVGADVKDVAQGMGLDNRIGRYFLHAGIGYGGSCFPKDLEAFINIADKLGYDFQILKAVRNTNEEQKKFVLQKIKDELWVIKDKTIAVAGLAFKPNTDDLRNAPSVDLVKALLEEGARVKVFDPKAMGKARGLLKDAIFCNDLYQAARAADCLVVATEWNEFKELDFARLKKMLKRPLVIDARNIYDPKLLKELGFTCIGVGRGNG
ncbi:MAG: UDP-glucose/GDP-mannose dehydrogenase family protein [Candidatus Omnitrophica bacterium]|nr:UDP-glucose/GDP-mannose dehydrogenase family protein [Candidatus Omnitrophota bacterium]MBU1923928.1 UDP-glucose/GDP-mannose dehydrogenase family protein [Candidatus Omnitrophota bacterium]